jgi:diaminopimelate epimerase
MDLPFVKMHGLGNDFVIIDARKRRVALDAARARAIADRHTGVGCDQVIVIEPARNGADAFMRIRNADGGEVGACGNATRCVASIVMQERGAKAARIETVSGILAAQAGANGTVTVDMGAPRFDWRDVPLAVENDTLHVKFSLGPLSDPVALSMGNPHAVFFVPDAEAVDLAALGPQIEHHAVFPERVNVGVCQVIAKDRVRLRVWERGAGITQACGTGACAAAVAGARRGLTGRNVTVMVDGGELKIDWRADDHVMMTGPVATSFTGALAL